MWIAIALGSSIGFTFMATIIYFAYLLNLELGNSHASCNFCTCNCTRLPTPFG